MNPEVRGKLDRAGSSLEAARVLAAEDLANQAAAEAYYAMFHAATAALAARDQSYSKHSAVISAFGREFAKTGELPAELHRRLREAFETRLSATYDYTHQVTVAEAVALCDEADQFIAAIEHYLQRR